MKKKQLNKRQLARIRGNQNAHADRLSRQDAPTLPEDSTLGPQRQGLVITHFGQQLDIEATEEPDKGALFRCFQRSNLEALVSGDRVIWQEGEPVGVVVAVLPRSTLLQRPNKFNELKPVAANIDRIIIVIASHPPPHYNLIDRYLVAAEVSGIQPVLLLNKLDLAEGAVLEELDAMLALYRKLGYSALRVSCRTRAGLDALHQELKGHTSIFVGQSGVGKSALVNALLPGIDTAEGALSEAEDKGKHTTTSARLYHLPQGGDLIDSPGIREFGLWHMDPADVLEGFVEFRPFIGQCRFRDCQHTDVNNCQLLQAAHKGLIDPRRLQSYQLICNSMAQEY